LCLFAGLCPLLQNGAEFRRHCCRKSFIAAASRILVGAPSRQSDLGPRQPEK